MNILIPKPGALQRKLIKAGSAIVAVERTDGSADISYEGNLYGAENLRSYWGRLLSAASRLAQQYPSVDVRNLAHHHIGPLREEPGAMAFNAKFPENASWHFVNPPVGFTNYFLGGQFSSPNDIVHALRMAIDVLQGKSEQAWLPARSWS